MKGRQIEKLILAAQLAALSIFGMTACSSSRSGTSSQADPSSQTVPSAQRSERTFEEIAEARRKAEEAIQSPDGPQDGDSVPAETLPENGQATALKEETIDGIYYKDGILIANKKHGLPADYAPGVDPTASAQVSALIADMIAQGMDVSYDTSNFRSYDTQAGLYNNYVAGYGQAEADTFSARPGYSEHQTGLAFDLKHSSGALLTGLTEAQWLLDNSWKYGFIVRYQEGKEGITGYQAEPWHLRYIGDKAQAIAQSGLCLEEYLGVDGGDYAQ